MKRKNDKQGTKKNKWQKTRFFWIIVWILFNPISVFIVSVVCLTHQAETIAQKNVKINDHFKEFCNGDEYVIHFLPYDYYFSNCKNDFYKHIERTDVLKTFDDNTKYNLFHLLLYTESNYYFLVYQSINPDTAAYYIAKADMYFDNFEILGTIGQDHYSSIDWASGLNKMAYFGIEDRYYTFDFSNYSLKEISSNSNEINYVKMTRKEYYESQGIIFDYCDETDGNYCFTYENNDYQFDSNNINESILSLMKKYKYFPLYHQSFPSGETSILCFSDHSFWDAPLGGYHPNCLIINYNRTTNKVISYQAFANVYHKSINLIHKITID